METRYGTGGHDDVQFIVNPRLHHVGAKDQCYEIAGSNEKKTSGRNGKVFPCEERDEPDSGKQGEKPSWVFHGPSVRFARVDQPEKINHGVRSFEEFSGVVFKKVAKDETGGNPESSLGRYVQDDGSVFPEKVLCIFRKTSGEKKAG